MTSEEVQEFIYKNIPILKTNNFTVGKVDKYCPEICGKLKDHINHRSTVFGGTISTALTVAAWSQLRLIMIGENIDAESVIARQSVLFRKPVPSDFKAITTPLSDNEILKMKRDLRVRGRARINIYSGIYIENDKRLLAKFKGEFVIFFEE